MSVRMDLHNLLNYSVAISPDEGAGDNTAKVSNIIDRQGFHALEFVIQTGTIGDAAATFTVLLEEGDASNLSDNTAVADADMLGTEAAAGFDQTGDDAVTKIGYIGSKRYVRLTITPAGNGTAWDIACLAVQSQRVA